MTVALTQLALLLLLLCLAVADDNRADVSRDAAGEALRTLARLGRAVDLTPRETDILRRISYVETRDGLLAEDHNFTGGGIWAVDRSLFLQTQSPHANSLVKSKRAKIRVKLGIDWENVEWGDLAQPLYSVAAAMLVLLLAPSEPPPVGHVTRQASFWREHYRHSGSPQDFLRAVRRLEGPNFQSSGSEYSVGFPRNIAGASQYLMVSTRDRKPVEFTVRTKSGIHFTGTATRTATTTVDLGGTFQVENSSDRHGGIQISARRGNLEVYGLNYQPYTSDTYLALPCSQLEVDEYEYFAASYGNSSGPNQILLVACRDNTTVEFGGSSVFLNSMETFLLEDATDITGRRFSSDKPISFFSGHLCTYVPRDVLACDHIIEQFPPTAVWGTRFLLASLSGRMSGDIYRIVASSRETNVDVLCTNPANLESYRYQFYLTSAGDWEELELPAGYFCYAEGSSPLLVVQFGLAHRTDYVGDPFMMTIPSLEQYGNFFTVRAVSGFSNSFVTILVPAEFFQPEEVVFDGENLRGAVWNPIYCPNDRVCGYATYVALRDGDHQVYHTSAVSSIGVLVYGFDAFNSYGHPAGLQFIPRELAVISFAQDEYTVGETSGAVEISLLRSGNTQQQSIVMVQSRATESSATEEQDYSKVIAVVVFEAGERKKSVEVVITDDEEVEKEREVVALSLTGGDQTVLTPYPHTLIAITDDDGALILSPSHGTQLGGTAHLLTTSSAVFQTQDSITCLFAGHPVKAVRLNDSSAVCVSPELNLTSPGVVDFEVAVERFHPVPVKTLLRARSGYLIVPVQNGFSVHVETPDGGPVLQRGSVATIHWHPTLFLPLTNTTHFPVGVTLRLLDPHTHLFDLSMPLAPELPNSGHARLIIPATPPTNQRTQEMYPLIPVVIEVGVNLSSLDLCPQSSGFGCESLRVAKHSSVRLLDLTSSGYERGLRCGQWAGNQPAGVGRRLGENVSSCPCTQRRAALANSGFKRDHYSSHSTSPPESPLSSDDVWRNGGQYRDGRLTDESYRKLLHKNASVCYRQRILFPFPSTGVSGQQCCYNDRGHLIVGPASGGTADLVSPDVDFLRHLGEDVIPQWLCCEAGPLSQCARYYQHRPSDDCSRSLPLPLPGWVLGDPHLVTLDGHRYTFNGRGEFTLTATHDGSFTLQGRMTDTTSGEISPQHSSPPPLGKGTALTAVAARERGADLVQFEVASGKLVLRVNRKPHPVVADEMRFVNVTVSSHAQNSLTATFKSGASIEVRMTHSLLSSLIVTLPDSYTGENGTMGLLGSYNGDPLDDLLPRFSDVPLPHDSSLIDIHREFGITWIVDTPADSLFAYETGKSWASYHDPYFTPTYHPMYHHNKSSLERRALEACEGDRECLFDAAATGSVDIALATLRTNLEIREMMQLMVPIVCEPACQNGACVANDTCSCPEGYTGDTCSETDGNDEKAGFGSIVVLIAGVSVALVIMSIVAIAVIISRHCHLIFFNKNENK